MGHGVHEQSQHPGLALVGAMPATSPRGTGRPERPWVADRWSGRQRRPPLASALTALWITSERRRVGLMPPGYRTLGETFRTTLGAPTELVHKLQLRFHGSVGRLNTRKRHRRLWTDATSSASDLPALGSRSSCSRRLCRFAGRRCGRVSYLVPRHHWTSLLRRRRHEAVDR